MHTPFEPYLLEDKTRLPEIFMLRVNAWENSPRSHVINSPKYPNGYFDNLEETGLHWVVENEQGQIIAAARGNVLNSFDELPYPGIVKGFELAAERPFFYYSRLAIHPNYRNLGISNKLDITRINYHEEIDTKFILATAGDFRISALEKIGFKSLGEINPDNDPDFIFKSDVMLVTPPNKHRRSRLLIRINDKVVKRKQPNPVK
jgi:GNAT superfamily N-acetyltransferase